MRIEPADIQDLRPVIEVTTREVLHQIEGERAQFGDHLAYPEAEAAAAIGVARHVLRDARLRGEIDGSRVGKKIVYTRDDLSKFLRQQRT